VNSHEFVPQILRLEEMYGEYSRDTFNAIYRELKHIRIEKFRAAIDRVIADHPRKYDPDTGRPVFQPALTSIENALKKINDHEIVYNREQKKKETAGKRMAPKESAKLIREMLNDFGVDTSDVKVEKTDRKPTFRLGQTDSGGRK
jgi:hypothetical protein